MNNQMTFKQVKEILSIMGVTIGKRHGEYRVNLKDGSESTAYYTECLDDAYNTGMKMSYLPTN